MRWGKKNLLDGNLIGALVLALTYWIFMGDSSLALYLRACLYHNRSTVDGGALILTLRDIRRQGDHVSVAYCLENGADGWQVWNGLDDLRVCFFDSSDNIINPDPSHKQFPPCQVRKMGLPESFTGHWTNCFWGDAEVTVPEGAVSVALAVLYLRTHPVPVPPP
jgi:hypothetical protein